MIYYTPAAQRTLSLFRTPFEQQLDANNRWVKMAELAPWDEMAKVFFSSMSKDHGRASIDLRIILGALLVKHIEGISDEDTIQYIQENIYAQYFVGLPSFQTKPVFVPTLGHINRMLDQLEKAGHAVGLWTSRDWHLLRVLNEVYLQQKFMYQDQRKRVDDRIVNIAQPYVRPIKRGKAGKDTEFGAKLNIPMSKEEKRKRKKEQNKRSEVEGKFGQAKSKYGMDDVKTRRMDTTFACIGLILLALNLIKLGKAIFISIFTYCYSLYKAMEGYQSQIRLALGRAESINQLKRYGASTIAIKLG